jgi:hypothetical protein
VFAQKQGIRLGYISQFTSSTSCQLKSIASDSFNTKSSE